MARLFLLFALSILACLLVPGCGGGRLALTGGSIPIGAARLQGRVVRADDIGRPIGGAAVVLSRGSASGVAFTDTEGNFAFDKIAGGNYLLTIHPPETAGLRVWSYQVGVPDKDRAQLMATMLPASVDPNVIARVRITPDDYSMNVGESVRFTAQTLNSSDGELNLRGSLMIQGDIGELGPDGTFIATKPGHTTLTGWAGSQSTSSEVTVVP